MSKRRVWKGLLSDRTSVVLGSAASYLHGKLDNSVSGPLGPRSFQERGRKKLSQHWL